MQRSHHFALAKLGQPVNNSSMPIRSIQSIVFLGFCVGCVLLSVLKPIAVAETTMQTFANADRYVGEMQNGQFHGQGAYFFSNGNEYEGAFHEGKYHGQGVFKFASGERYEGEFRNGKFHGHGVYTWAGGLRFEGVWQNNQKWTGTVYSQWGTVAGTYTEGKWESAL